MARHIIGGLFTAAALLATGWGAGPAAQAPVQVPLVPGLTIVTAYTLAGVCDCESVKQITTVDEDSVSLTYSSDVPSSGVEGLFGGGGSAGEVKTVRGRRTIRRLDLESARDYVQTFGEGLPEVIPGTTALGVSSAVLRDLKRTGESPLTMRSGGLGTAISGFLGALTGGVSGAGVAELEDLDKLEGSIARVEPSAVPFRVLVNGASVELAAIHASGTLGGEPVDLYVLDDERNPLALKWALGDNRLQLTKVAFPEPSDAGGQPARIAEELAAAGRVDVYGIYFDFDSDVLKPESAPVLREIAAALAAQPDWRLSIEGHTDAVGADAHNLDLSQRRAAAVKAALVANHQVAAARLSTAGFGASRPKETNDTIEGRARNRRVELVRQ
jgi:outer membrane protein OmpA-like peptidoglycan-associated protein